MDRLTHGQNDRQQAGWQSGKQEGAGRQHGREKDSPHRHKNVHIRIDMRACKRIYQYMYR